MEGLAYWIEKRKLITPERIALIGNDSRLTYRQMADIIDQVAVILSKVYHAKKGDRIGVLSGNSIEYLMLLFSIAKIGSIAVPLNVRLSEGELDYQLKDSQSSMLIVSKELYERGNNLIRNDNIKHLIILDELLFGNNLAASMSTATKIDSGIDGSTPFVIIYTSGTTGKPKGAVLTQENMYWNSINNIFAIDITSYDRVLTVLPLFHIGGIGLFTLPTLLAGGTVVIPNYFQPGEALEIIEKEEITIFMGVPTIFEAIRRSDRLEKTNLKSIRWFYSGGAPCPQELINFFIARGIAFGQGYGMTETSPTVFMLSKEDYNKKVGSIGKPVMFVDIRIVDDNGNDIETGEIGELIFRGPNVLKEYWNLPNETAKSFKDGWFYSGDLARKDEDGFIYIAGRKKDMIISGGENIYPLEVEQVFLEHPNVNEIAVIGTHDDKWGEVPIAIISLKNGITDKVELINHCQARLAKYKCPKRIDFVNELPKNATGKIDKAYLKRTYSNQD